MGRRTRPGSKRSRVWGRDGGLRGVKAATPDGGSAGRESGGRDGRMTWVDVGWRGLRHVAALGDAILTCATEKFSNLIIDRIALPGVNADAASCAYSRTDIRAVAPTRATGNSACEKNTIIGE